MRRTSHLGLVERDEELADVERALTAARIGSGRVLLVEGEAGLGKSALLSALRTSAQEAGVRVLAARGAVLERDFGFHIATVLLRNALRDGQPLLAETSAPVRRLLGLQEPGRAVLESSPALLDGVFHVVEALADDAPVLLCVDDVQWADAASLRALAYVAHRLEELPVLLALGRRTGEPASDPDALEAIAKAPGAVTVRPAPLSPAGTLAACRAAGGPELPQADVAALHAVTAGNPLLIHQAIVELRRTGTHDVASVTGTVSTLVGDRLQVAGPAAASVARAVALLGDNAPLGHVVAVAGLDVPGVLDAAARLEELGVFRDDEPLSFAHPLLAAAVEESGGANARGRARLRAAALLRTAGADSNVIAQQLLRGPAAGDAAAVADLRAAAADARARAAPELAVQLLTRALAEPPAPAERSAVSWELGLAEIAAGDPHAAAEHLQSAVADPAADVLTVTWAGMVTVLAGDMPGGLQQMVAAAAAREATDPDAALALRGLVEYFNFFVPVELRHDARLPSNDELSGATRGERMALAGVLAHAIGPGTQAAPVQELAQRALHGGAMVADDGMSLELVAGPILGLIYAEALDDAASAVEDVAASAIRGGSPAAYINSRFPLVCLLHARGELAATIAESLALLELRDTLMGPLRFTLEGFVVGTMALAILEHDGVDAALADLADRGLDGELSPDRFFLNASRAHVHLAAGRPEDALIDAQAWRNTATAIGDPISTIAQHTALPLALLAVGREDEARAEAERELQRARAWGTPGRIAAHLRVLARTTPERAIALLEEAAPLAASSALRGEEALVLLDLGRAYRQTSQKGLARETLERAAQMAQECQMHRSAGEAVEELRVLGARPRRLAFSGADSLTASEHRVAQLAAEGATNREIAQRLFITVKTVDSHLTRTYRKLGISSRRELAAALG